LKRPNKKITQNWVLSKVDPSGSQEAMGKDIAPFLQLRIAGVE
jgi:hypothetical protein